MSRFKPVFQTRFSSKDGLEHGNCFTACVASLLGLSIPETPDLNAPELQDGSWIHPFLDACVIAISMAKCNEYLESRASYSETDVFSLHDEMLYILRNRYS